MRFLLAMALLFTDQSDNATHVVPRGVSTGHVLLTASNQTFAGATSDPADTVIRLDGTYNSALRATENRGGYTLRNLTIDCAALAGVAALEINQHTPVVTVENVVLLDAARGTLAVDQRGTFTATNLALLGCMGAGILQRPDAVSTTIRGMFVVGGQYAFHHTTAGAGIDLERLHARLDYFASPTAEAVEATGYAPTYADVAAHAEADRTLGDIVRHLAPVVTYDAEHTLRSPLVQLRDRVEVAGVAWTQVLGGGAGGWVLDDWRAWGSWRPVSQPSGTARVLRASLGYVIGWSASRLLLQLGVTQPPAPRWRRWNGAAAPVPVLTPGARLDLIRHGGPHRDTDSGAIHVNEHAVNARVVGCTVFGGASDMITMRGVGSVVEDCSVAMGYDMGFTIDGTDGRVTVRRCRAEYAGRTGFHLSGGPSDVYSCWAEHNGTINDGSGDFGLTTTAACAGSTVQVRGSGNLDGRLGGLILTESAGGFDRAIRAVTTRRTWEQLP